MADDIDRTQDRLDLEEELRKKYKPIEPVIQGSGHCLNCGASVTGVLRWCDSDCRDDWEQRAT
jgi:hypothetical protein